MSHLFKSSQIIILPALFACIFFYMTLTAEAQFKTKYSVSLGINTITIMGNNAAVKPMFERGSDVFGGSFNGPQTGLSIRFFMTLDEDEDFVMPIGLDYNFYRGLERYPISKFISIKRRHEVDIPVIAAGLNYNFWRWPLAKAKAYVGMEIRGAFVSQGSLEDTEEYFQLDSTYTTTINTKDAAFRLGGALRLGIEGIVYERLYVNFSGAVGVMNLIGRDDERGELLTPFKELPLYNETEEQLLAWFQYAFTLQYRL